MKNFKSLKTFQIANLIGAIFCGLLLTFLVAWTSAGEEIKHPCLSDIQAPCLEPYGTIFLYYGKKYIVVCIGSFLAAFVLQLIISWKYFHKFNGISIGVIGFVIFCLTNNSSANGIQDFLMGGLFIILIGLVFSLVMAFILIPASVYQRKLSEKC